MEISAEVDNNLWFPKTPPAILVYIGENNMHEDYKTLFVEGNWGAIQDMEGFDSLTDCQLAQLNDEIESCEKEFLSAIESFSYGLLELDEDGIASQESEKERRRYLESEGLEKDFIECVNDWFKDHYLHFGCYPIDFEYNHKIYSREECIKFVNFDAIEKTQPENRHDETDY